MTHIFSIAVAWLAAIAIIGIGIMYLARPRAIAPSFGLPLPASWDSNVWWLRLKGVRDITSGLIVIAALGWGDPIVLGAALLIAALIPLGDMSLVLASGGSKARALGIHLPTAALMIVAGALLVTGQA